LDAYFRGESRFKRKSSPQVVRIFGEYHQTDSSFDTQHRLADFFKNTLKTTPNSQLYIEAFPEGVTSNPRFTGTILTDVAKTLYNSPQNTGNVHLIDFRRRQSEYPPHLQWMTTYSEPKKSRSPAEIQEARQYMLQQGERHFEKFPFYKKLVENATLPEWVGTPYFKAPKLDAYILDIIQREKDKNLLFYVGDLHREHLSEALQAHHTHKYIGKGFTFIGSGKPRIFQQRMSGLV
jgi:hypothetical protein